ncbi:MAG: hypothetical protein C0432_05930 [Candidatus Puniceispirillum sp.]|nr:hypothetical protein [Candidatus Pelagibacter sp.]MBA4283813.1 hypothetical protein [Candidatus Puniceispirillum sp.]
MVSFCCFGMTFFRKFIFFNLAFFLQCSVANQDKMSPPTTFDHEKSVPFFEIGPDFFDEILPGRNISKKTDAQQSPYLDQTSNCVDVKAYFASSCAHCGHFFKDGDQGLLKVINELVKTNLIRLWFRPLVLHAADLTIMRLCINHDGNRSYDFMGFEKKFASFIQNQDQWMPYLQTQEYKTEEDKVKYKSSFLRDHAAKWGINIEEENKNLSAADKEILFIDASNQNASVILFARGVLRLSPDQIRRALDPSEDETFMKLAFATQNQAKKNKTQPIDAVPAFFINGEFKGVLGYPDLVKIAKK